MRITSGFLRSRLIKHPKDIRPTQDKVRKALFDILQARVPGSNFLELFAGSGSVGIEALSNGASEAVFVENDSRCCRIISDNLMGLGLTDRDKSAAENISILTKDAFKAVESFYKKGKKFDLIFLDPPYYEDLAKKALQKLSAYDILAPSGLIVAEHSRKDCLEDIIGNLTRFKQKRYGAKSLSFYSKSSQ